MKNKLKYLVGVSLGRKVKTKWFIISQIVLGLLIIGMINVDTIINAFGGDFNKSTKVYIIDETEKSFDIFKESLELNAESIHGKDSNMFEIVKSDSLEEVKETVNKDGGIIIQIMTSKTNGIELNLISKESLDNFDTAIITSAANNVKVLFIIEELGISSEEYMKIMSDVVINKSLINEGQMTEEESTDMIMSTVFPVLILPVFMLIIFLVQMVGAEVNDEKTTKAMEIIIANVSPKVHFFAKVIAGNTFVLIQGGLLVLYLVLGLAVRGMLGSGVGTDITGGLMEALNMVLNSSLGEKLIFIIPLTLILIILTFIAYSLVAGILASMTTTTEDYQQVQTPIMIILLLGYYLAIMAGMFKGSLLIKILSFIPFVSAILCPSLLVLGQIGFIEVIISILIMIGTIYILVKYGLKIYKVGILNYSSSGLWKKMAKALKE